MIRNVVAIIAGIFVGALIIYAFEALGQMAFPPPFEYDPADVDIFLKLTHSDRLTVLIPILVAYFAGSMVGGFLAGVVSKGGNLLASFFTGFVLMGFGLVNLFTFYHPTWFWIASLLIYIPVSLLGGLLAARAKKN